MANPPPRFKYGNFINALCEIEVTVVGNRRNTFGPLHLLPKRKIYYSPSAYVTVGENWSDEYELLGNALFSLTLLGCKEG